MLFNNPIIKSVQPKFHEGSPMRSVRDADNNSKQWLRNKTSQNQNNSYGNAITILQREMLRLKRRIVGGGSGSSVKQFKITSIPGGMKDYFIAREWDGTTLGSDDYTIAKAFEYRPSVTAVTILGTALTYTYSDDNHRSTHDGINPDQSEELYFPFEVDAGTTNGIFQAAQMANDTGVLDAGGNAVDWIDLRGRVWAKYA